MKQIVPQTALFVILHYWSAVVFLVSQVLYERLAQKYQQHFLVQFDQVIDLTAIEQGCAGYHTGSGRGSWTVHTIPQLVRALLVKYLFVLSYRETEEQIDLNLLVKYWVGYNLLQNPMDHTTLCRFELWVLKHQPRLIFDEIIRQIDEMFPEDRERMQIVDTYAMLVRGAKTSIIELVRDVSRHILSELEKADPQRYTEVVNALNMVVLFGAEDEKLTAALDPEERDARLQVVVTQALRLHRLVSSSLDYLCPLLSPETQAPVREWLDHLSKIIHDETTVTSTDPTNPEVVTVTERPHKKKGQYRIACANDTDATYRDHGKGKQELANNAALLGTRYFVRETEVVTGSTPDPVPLTTMLANQYQYHGFFPKEVCGDQIFGTGKTRADVAAVSGGQATLIALLPDYEKRTDRFVPANFTPLSPEEGLGLICPTGVLSTRWNAKPDAEGITFDYTAQMCQGCPFWVSLEQLSQNPDLPHCRKPDCKPNSRRRVFISHHRPYVLDAIEYNKTEAFKLKMKQRPLIERLIFNLTNIHGGRRARSTGLEKANFQTRMVASVFNIRQILRLWPNKQAEARAVRANKPPPSPAAIPLTATAAA